MMCAACGKRPIKAKGLCDACYARQRRTQGGKPCAAEGCENPAISRGLCSKHAQQAKRRANARTIPGMPGESWREIEGHPQWLISDHGRVKSLRGQHERLIVPRIVNGRMFVEDKRGGSKGFAVHLQVLRTFRPEATGDPIFIDGNILNARLDNLRWDTRQDKLHRAIAMAEASSSPWGPAFSAYWRGDKHALDGFFIEIKARLLRTLHRKMDSWHRGYHLNVDEVAHVTLVRLFFAIHAATISDLDGIVNYALTVANRVLAGHWSYAAPLTPMETIGDSGQAVSVLDAAGWCSPSAELVAIAREQAAIITEPLPLTCPGPIEYNHACQAAHFPCTTGAGSRPAPV